MPQVSELKRLKQSRAQCTVVVDAEEFAKAENAALARIAPSVNIEGFRPGKAPPEMVRGKVSEDALLEETIRSILPQVIEKAVKEQNLRPILPPRVEVQSKAPLTILMTFVERPTVKVKNIDTSKLKKAAPKFDEKDIERMVSYLLEQYRTTEPVDRAAEDGDQVTMDFVGMAEGKEVPGTRSTNYSVVLGSKSLIPGFEEGLKGVKKGDKRDLNLTFPEKYHAEQLAGKPVTFNVEVKGIDKVHTPALTPEFVKEKGLGDSPEDVRKRIADSMQEEEERMDHDRRERLLFDEIRQATQIDLAPELVADEQQALVEELGRQLDAQQITFQDWLKRSKRTAESVQKELEEEATRRLVLRFGLQQLMEDKQIQTTPEEMKEAIATAIAALPEAERKQAEPFYAEGEQGFEQMRWQKRVEKLVKMMLD